MNQKKIHVVMQSKVYFEFLGLNAIHSQALNS